MLNRIGPGMSHLIISYSYSLVPRVMLIMHIGKHGPWTDREDLGLGASTTHSRRSNRQGLHFANSQKNWNRGTNRQRTTVPYCWTWYAVDNKGLEKGIRKWDGKESR